MSPVAAWVLKPGHPTVSRFGCHLPSKGKFKMVDLTISQRSAAPLHAFEIWSNAAAVAKRFEAATGFALPPMGRSGGTDALRLIRYEPTVWLVEGDASALPDILAEDGSLTPIGGGIVRVRLSGEGWRTLLMEGGVFDAESPTFTPGSSAATIIDHVAVRLHVVSDDACDVYVPASFSAGLVHFWEQAQASLPPFSSRSFLRHREALLVHFSTPMSTKHPTGFPDDLRCAAAGVGHPISFSTIQVGDHGPFQCGASADASAGGSVGIVIDIQDDGSVQSVYPGDSGSIPGLGSMGYPPNPKTCADSIDSRTTSNEWVVQNYTKVGIFMFGPARVFVKTPNCQGEVDCSLATVLAEFPKDRIFSVHDGSFMEYNRAEKIWSRIQYGDIISH
jgi:heterotetrameric sarcosine oxidase gamma subunit